MSWLRYNTNSQTVEIGPFVDDTDGKTPETGLTISNTDIRLHKHNATSMVAKNSGGATHMENGVYYLTLDSTDTNAVGKLVIYVFESGALYCKKEFLVVPNVIYDSFVGGSDLISVSVAEWLGTTVPTPATAGVPEVDIAAIDGEIAATATLLKSFLVLLNVNPGNVGKLTSANFDDGFLTAAKLASNALTSAKIADDAITADKFAANAVDANALAADAVLEIVAGVLDRVLSGNHDSAGTLGKIAQDLNSRLTATRAGYLDKLNITGNVASQADVLGLAMGWSRRLTLTTTHDFERPETGTSEYEIELRAFDEEGSPVAADSTPSLAATGAISGDLSANLSAISNPATGVYRWTYTVASSDDLEQVRLEATAAIDSTSFGQSVYPHVTDAVAADFTVADRADLQAAKAFAEAAETASESADGKLTSPRLAKLDNLLASGTYSTLTQAQVNAEADQALADYGGPTRAEATADKEEIIAALPSEPDNAGIAAIKLKTDLLPASPAATGDIPSAATNASAVRTNLATELARIDVATSTRSSHAASDVTGGRTVSQAETAILNAIDDIEGGGGGSGAGSEIVTVTVQDFDNASTKIQGIPVSAFSAGVRNGIDTSDADGELTLHLNPGVYDLSGLMAGVWDMHDPNQTITVVDGGPNAFVMPMDAVSRPAHADPEKSIGYFVTWDNEGNREGNVSVSAWLKTFPDGSAGNLFDDEPWTVESDENGDGQFGSNEDETGLFRGAWYRFRRGDQADDTCRYWDIQIPDSGSFSLGPFAGSP